jgi:hypothetical protein
MKKFILKSFLKVVLMGVVFNLYAEYVISRELPGSLQILSTVIVFIFIAAVINSIFTSLINLKTKNK